MEKIAEQRSGIELTCFVGNLEEGALLARKYAADDYDIIISRGGTAELIQRSMSIPVINIPLSVYDTLRAIRLSEHYTHKHAIVGFPSITKNAHFLCEMFQYDIDIYTMHDDSQVHDTLKSLKDKGYQMILCDMITDSLARQYNLSSILITSGAESIEMAFDQAVETYHLHAAVTRRSDLFSGIMKNLPMCIMVYNRDHELIFRNIPSESSLYSGIQVPPSLPRLLEPYIDSVAFEGKKLIHIEEGSCLLTAAGISYFQDGQEFILFQIDIKKKKTELSHHGITFLNADNLDETYKIFYQNNSPVNLPTTTPGHYAGAFQPIVLKGGEGTDKLQYALLLFCMGEQQSFPFLDIDCEALDDASWSLLFDQEQSLLNVQNHTFFFRNMDSLTDRQFSHLLNLIRSWKLCEGNRLLFAFDSGESSPCCRRVCDELACLSLTIPSLYEQRQNIPNLASLYISHLNMQLGREISGFEPGSLELLMAYPWPGSYNQFKRIMTELVSAASSINIRTEDVKKILQQEKDAVSGETDDPCFLDLSGTLEEINLKIVKQVLYEENYNQSNTAKRLGIGRSTLWRMLQK